MPKRLQPPKNNIQRVTYQNSICLTKIIVHGLSLIVGSMDITSVVDAPGAICAVRGLVMVSRVSNLWVTRMKVLIPHG